MSLIIVDILSLDFWRPPFEIEISFSHVGLFVYTYKKQLPLRTKYDNYCIIIVMVRSLSHAYQS